MQSGNANRLKVMRIIFYFALVIICIHNPVFSLTNIANAEDYRFLSAYGGFGDENLAAADITGDNGMIVAGWTESFGAGARDFMVLKLDLHGEIKWQKTYGGTASEMAYSVQQTSEGGYVVAGISGSNNDDILILKLDADGAVGWQKTYSGPLKEDKPVIRQTTDGGYVLAAQTGSFDVSDPGLWLLRLKSDGTILWTKTYSDDAALSSPTIELTDDGFVVACTASSPDGKNDIRVFKLNSDGVITWQNTYGGDGFDYQPVIRPLADGKYNLAGTTHSTGAGPVNIWLSKLKSDGQIEWQKTMGQADTIHRLADLRLTNDNGFIIAGNRLNALAQEQIALFKFDSENAITWQKNYTSATTGVMQVRKIYQTGDDNFLAAGNVSVYNTDFLVMRPDNQGQLVDCSIDDSNDSIITEVIDPIISVNASDLTFAEIEIIPQTSDLSAHDIDIIPHFFCKSSLNIPRISSVSPTITLNDGTSSTEIRAEVTIDTGNVKGVWALITPVDGLVNTEPGISPSRIELIYDENVKKYKAIANGFSYFGKYKVTIYAIDDKNNTSLPVSTWVHQDFGPDIYEEDDSPLQAVLIDPDHPVTQRHNFYDTDDHDWVKFYGIAGEPYSIIADNLDSKCDVVLELYHNGSLLERIDIEKEGKDEILNYPIIQGGEYYVRVSQYDTNNFGVNTGYDLKVNRPKTPKVAIFNGDIIDNSSKQNIANSKIQPNFSCRRFILSGGHFSIEATLEFYKVYEITISADGYYSKSFPIILYSNGVLWISPEYYMYKTLGLEPKPSGLFTVNINPEEAVQDGAKWRVDNGVWLNSGHSLSGLTAGYHTITYKSVSGWNKPAEQDIVYLQANQPTDLERTYARQTGKLQISLDHADGRWQMDNDGVWHDDPEILKEIPAGDHDITYKPVNGWNKPADETVQIKADLTLEIERHYTQIRAIKISLLPPDAVNDDAQWQLNGGAWHDSGEKVSSLTPGDYTVSFKKIYGWNKPEDITLSLGSNELITRTANYSLKLDQETYIFKRLWPSLLSPTHFDNPMGIATDGVGNVYVADSNNHCIRKFTADGYFMAKWGEHGTGFGEFEFPAGIAVDADGFVYVADTGNCRIQKFTSGGAFVTSWGQQGSGGLQFESPRGVAVASDGTVFVADTGNQRIKKLNANGVLMQQWGDAGMFEEPCDLVITDNNELLVVDTQKRRILKFDLNGGFSGQWGAEGNFSAPASIAIDAQGAVYVLDKEHRVQKFSPDGVFTEQYALETFPAEIQFDCRDGLFCGEPESHFKLPEGLAVSHSGSIYVADSGNNRIQKFDSDGTFTDVWQNFNRSHDVNAGNLHSPQGVATAADGSIYVADTVNHCIRKFSAGGQEIEKWGEPGSATGHFNQPDSVAVASDGTLYVADTGNNRIQKFDSDNNTWQIFTSAALNAPHGIAVDSNGAVYVADTGNGRVLTFDESGGLDKEWNDFEQPLDIAVDSENGLLYVADAAADRILKLDTAKPVQWENFTTVELNAPRGVFADNYGNVFTADTQNHRILKFNSNGDQIASFGRQGTEPGKLKRPADVSVDSDGNVYVVDSGCHRIQVFRKKQAAAALTKAIIVAGGGPQHGNYMWDATQLCANRAYSALMHQGFNNDTIRYLTFLNDQERGQRDYYDIIDANKDNLEWAITQWARNADNLVIYLADHGGIENFPISGSEILYADELAQWLDILQDTLPGVITVIYEACYSGSFINALESASEKPRIIITSSAAGSESNYMVAQGLISFSGYFWGHISNGLNLQDAFEQSYDAIHQTFEHQEPMMNDSAGIAQNTYIGNGAISEQHTPEIINISAPDTISNQSNARIIVDVIDEDNDVVHVRALVQPLSCSTGEDIVMNGALAMLDPQQYGTGESGSMTKQSCKKCHADRLAMVAEIPEEPVSDCIQRKAAGSVVGLSSVDLVPVEGQAGRYEIIYNSFDQETEYQVAVYARDSAGNVSATKTVNITVENPLGRRAVLLAGGSSSHTLWPLIKNIMKSACQAFASQGYQSDNVYLFSPQSIPDAEYSDVSPTLDILQNIIENWAAQGTRDVVLYMVGAEGAQEAFPIADGEILTAADLDKWLDNLQAKIPGTITVIYDGCRSGSFLNQLTPPEGKQRIVIASTSAERTALFDADSELSFSGYFWKQVRNGVTLWDAFKYARMAVEFITQHLPGGKITAELDDNGNGAGNDKNDGDQARDFTFSAGFRIAPDNPTIGDVSEPVILRDGSTLAFIYAGDVTSVNTIDRVWMAVIPPDTDSTAIPLTDLHTVELVYNPSTERYEGVYLDCDINGIYGVSIHARDINGNLAQPATTKIIQLNAPQSGRIKAISAGDHIVALENNGDVWAWGSNYKGSLGDGTNVDSSTPVKAVGITDVIAIDAGNTHTLALRVDGTVWAWGNNELGQLGDGSQIDRYTPVKVSNLSNVIAISGGPQLSVALKEDGTVWTWGNRDYQFFEFSTKPIQVLNIPNIVKVKAHGSGFFTTALDIEGNVWGWGPGTPISSYKNPVKIVNIENIIDISAGFGHIMALGEDGKVWTWGANQYGQLGIGSIGDQLTPVQVDYFPDDIAIKIEAGWYRSLAIKDENVYAWGFNLGGMLGNGELINSYTPRKVLNISNVKEVAAGFRCSVALLKDGTVWTWGQNYNGQLGDGSENHRYTPAPIAWAGSVQINIPSSDPLNKDAFWKIDDGEWRAATSTLTKLSEGSHTISFSRIPCRENPGSVNITIQEGETLMISPGYEKIPDCTPGDINGDTLVDLRDAIVALQTMSGYDTQDNMIRPEYEYNAYHAYGAVDADINGDNRVGMDELIYILEVIAEQR